MSCLQAERISVVTLNVVMGDTRCISSALSQKPRASGLYHLEKGAFELLVQAGNQILPACTEFTA